VGDAVSRRPAACSLMEISADWKSHLLVEYSKNKFTCEVMDGKIQDDRYRVIENVIFYKERVYLVPYSELKKNILTVVHDSPLAGHQWFFKSYKQIKERFSWKGLKHDVMRHIIECVTFQQNKSDHTLLAGLLQPLPIPEQKWESILLGFITGLPKIHGKDCIYVVVDRLTKFSHFYAIVTEYNAVQVAKLFFKEVFKLHGLLRNIINDRDSRFIRTFWRDLFRLGGTELTPSTNYHPHIDGHTDIIKNWVEGYLRNYVGGQQRTCVKWLHLGEHFYNTTFHMSIGMKPFIALYGYDAPTLVDLVFGESRAPKEKDWITKSQDILKLLKENLQTTQNRHKMSAYRNRIEHNFEVGDLVFLRLQPYKQSSLKKRG
jgi:hypothetical protein